jgi:hypothetical protein
MMKVWKFLLLVFLMYVSFPEVVWAGQLDYATISSLPCLTYLKAYRTTRFDAINDPIVEHMSVMDANSSPNNSLGSNINISNYVLTECRLNETFRIGEAVFHLFEKQHLNHLPRIPIGGATDDIQAHAEWNAFDKWIHHRGPLPTLTQH